MEINDNPFRELIQRIRTGDADAATELLRRYEPTIRLVVRRRLTDPKLRRVLDSTDICQSILANFFVGASLGQFELDQPEQLLKLLATMARNKITSHARKQQAQRRTPPTGRLSFEDEKTFVDPASSPSQVVANRELLREFQQRLTEEERRLVDLRGQGRSWTEIAGEMAGNPDALRMQHSRAIDRVARELGLT